MPTLTPATIARRAFNRISTRIGDVIFDAVMTTSERGPYNRLTGEYEKVEGTEYPCRVVVEKTNLDGNIVGSYIVSEKERVLYIEGLKVSPLENARIRFNNDEKTITYVDDVLFSGTFFKVVVR